MWARTYTPLKLSVGAVQQPSRERTRQAHATYVCPFPPQALRSREEALRRLQGDLEDAEYEADQLRIAFR